MEIKTSMVTCPHCGRPYDSARNAGCPHCGAGRSAMASGGAFAPTEAPGGTGAFAPTEAPGGTGAFAPTEAPGGAGAFSATEPPNGAFGAAPGYNSGFSATLPPDGYAPAAGDGPINRFDVPTIIGGERADGDVSEPVVGWLVCIEGPSRGADFRLHAGYNYIGRETGDVRIRGDQQISRRNHAMVAYDSGEHLYFVGPSAGRNLIKVNGHAVLQAIEIKNYDVISIGSTKLLFLGLCGERFSWEKREAGNG